MLHFKLVISFPFSVGIFPLGIYVNPGIMKAKMYIFTSPLLPPSSWVVEKSNRKLLNTENRDQKSAKSYKFSFDTQLVIVVMINQQL